MDDAPCDGLIRPLAQSGSRRLTARALGAAALGGLLVPVLFGAADAEGKKRKKKKKTKKKNSGNRPAPPSDRRPALSTGWTHVTGTTSGIVFYEADTGLLTSGKFGGGDFKVSNSLDVGSGWTNVVGAGRGLFFYRSGNGAAATGYVDDDGRFVLVGDHQYTDGWTMFSGTRSGRYPWYKAGALNPNVLTDDGRIGGGCFEQKQVGAWTHFVGAGFGTFLFYNSATGAAKTARIDDTGPCAIGSGRDYRWTLLDDHAFAQGWTHAVGTFAGGVLFYRASDGFGGTGFLDQEGRWTQTGNPSFGAGWTHVTGAGADGLLLYDANTGKAVGGALGADGAWRKTITYG